MNPTTVKLISYFGVSSAVVNPALIFAPLLVGGAVATLGCSTGEAVSIVSIELFSTALAAIPALWWVVKISWRKVAVVSMLAVMLGNFASVFCESAQSLLLVRGLTGLFEGTLLSLYMAVIAKARQPERIFGGKLALQMFVGAVGLAFFPSVIGSWGVQAVYGILGLATLGLLLGVVHFPAGQGGGLADTKVPAIDRVAKARPQRWRYAVLVLLFVFGAGINGIWTFLERIGAAYGLSLETVGWTASVSSVLAILCGILCAVAGTRFGRLMPMSVGLLLGLGGSIILFMANDSMLSFTVGVCLVTIARVVPVPYLFGFVAQLDHKGTLAVLSHIAIAAGMALGPALAVPIFANGGIEAVLIVGMLLLSTTWLMALKLAQVIRISGSF